MAQIDINRADGFASHLDREIGPSDWLTVDQARIDAFAACSGDRQWIHVDTERAANESPFGTTIAHGNLTLSLIDGIRGELISVSGIDLAINYGWDRVRFPAPVPAGGRIRVNARITSAEDLGGGWWHVVTRFTVELEASDKPCCVADSLSRFFTAPGE